MTKTEDWSILADFAFKSQTSMHRTSKCRAMLRTRIASREGWRMSVILVCVCSRSPSAWLSCSASQNSE